MRYGLLVSILLIFKDFLKKLILNLDLSIIKSSFIEWFGLIWEDGDAGLNFV